MPGDRSTDYRIDVDGRIVRRPVPAPARRCGELDLHLIGEGRHERLWTVLGARAGRDGGVAFAVWAPNAAGVRVVGDFTGWGPHDGWPMRSMGGSGVWELFVPDAGPGSGTSSASSAGTGCGGRRPTRWPRYAEVPDRTASVVFASEHEWGDGDWLANGARPARRTSEPMSVYEVHLGSWRPGLSYAELAEQLTDVRGRAGLHPRRVHAGDGAPVRRLLGLPGHRLLRADRPASATRTVCGC